MSAEDDEKTPPDGPFAKTMERLLTAQFAAFERNLRKHIEGSEARILASVVNTLSPRLTNLELSQRASEHQISEIKRRLSNLEEIVRCARAETEPPPPTERGT